MLYSALNQLILKGAAIDSMVKKIVGEEVYDAAKAQLATRDLQGGLTDDEQVALYAWTMDTGKEALYVRINRALRTGEGMDELAPLIEAIESGLDKLPNFEGVGYRSVKETPMGKEAYRVFMQEHNVGNIVTYDGLTATSIDKNNVLRGRLKFTVWVKSGADISGFSSKPEQLEVLIKSSAKFQVLRNETRPSGAIDIWLQQL